jgi:hypothetical protein
MLCFRDASGGCSAGSDPVSALAPFESSDPVGASPVGALPEMAFDWSSAKCQSTEFRLIPSVLAILRLAIYAANNCSIPCVFVHFQPTYHGLTPIEGLM